MIQKCLIQRGIVKYSLGDGGFRWLRHLRYKNFQKLKIKFGLGKDFRYCKIVSYQVKWVKI